MKNTKQNTKSSFETVQIVLGRICNLSCAHCPVDAGPHCKVDLLPKTLEEVITFISRFDEIKTIELTGGEPGMHNGFMRIIQMANKHNKKVIVRTNLTIYLEKYFEDIPEFLSKHNVHILGSFPCVNTNVVDALMGEGVFSKSISALQLLNENGYGKDPALKLDLIHYPALPEDKNFRDPPQRALIKKKYCEILKKEYDVTINDVYVLLHIPTGRMKKYLLDKNLYEDYLIFLESHAESQSLPHLKKNAISIDYNGMVSICDPIHIDDIPVRYNDSLLDLGTLLKENTLEIIQG